MLRAGGAKGVTFVSSISFLMFSSFFDFGNCMIKLNFPFFIEVVQTALMVQVVSDNVDVRMVRNAITYQEVVHAQQGGEACFAQNLALMATSELTARYVAKHIMVRLF